MYVPEMEGSGMIRCDGPIRLAAFARSRGKFRLIGANYSIFIFGSDGFLTKKVAAGFWEKSRRAFSIVGAPGYISEKQCQTVFSCRVVRRLLFQHKRAGKNLDTFNRALPTFADTFEGAKKQKVAGKFIYY
ncbi:MAG: hypothetical protein JNJ90_00135 [Saprospiraceae bacterium]|jgi:hypothetical protein|nr:hypothetical protein [Saprospiraceae bacterium]